MRSAPRSRRAAHTVSGPVVSPARATRQTECPGPREDVGELGAIHAGFRTAEPERDAAIGRMLLHPVDRPKTRSQSELTGDVGDRRDLDAVLGKRSAPTLGVRGGDVLGRDVHEQVAVRRHGHLGVAGLLHHHVGGDASPKRINIKQKKLPNDRQFSAL